LEKLDDNELAILRWVLGQCLLIVSLLGGYTVDLGSGWLVTAGLGLTFLSLFRPGLTGAAPRWSGKVAPLLLLLIVVLDFLQSGGDILPPLYRMVVLLALYRALQARSPREDLQQLALTLFMMLLTGVLSQEVGFAVQLLVYTPLAMFLLFTVTLSQREIEGEVADELPARPVFGLIPRRVLLRRVCRRLEGRTLLAVAGLAAAMTALSLLLFLSLPRFDIGQSLPFPELRAGSSLTGFSDHIRYGDVVNILEDDRIALRADAPETNPPARPYWRMVVLDGYYDGGYVVSPDALKARERIRQHRLRFGRLTAAEGRDEEWTLYLAGGVSAYLPTGSRFGRVLFNNRQELLVDLRTRVLRRTEIPASTFSLRYEMVSFDEWIPATSADHALRKVEPQPFATGDENYLDALPYPATTTALPEGESNRKILAAALAASGIAQFADPEKRVRRLSLWLRSSRGYSLRTAVPEGEADTLLRWLASGEPGHCELFAGSLALLARAAGHPSRVVTGFAGGDWNGYENYFMVRNRHAHAWCEVWVPEGGWLRLDPTPGAGQDAGTVESALAQGSLLADQTFTAYLDSLRMLWYRRVIQFDEEDQELMRETAQDLGEEAWSVLKEAVRGTFQWWRDAFREAVEGEGRERSFLQALTPVFLILGTGAGLALALRVYRKRGYTERVRRRAGRLLREGDRKGSGPVPAREGLRLLRYGPPKEWPQKPEGILREGRSWARRRP
jgi:transglutaminase-like putative cysteine protease